MSVSEINHAAMLDANNLLLQCEHRDGVWMSWCLLHCRYIPSTTGKKQEQRQWSHNCHLWSFAFCCVWKDVSKTIAKLTQRSAINFVDLKNSFASGCTFGLSHAVRNHTFSHNSSRLLYWAAPRQVTLCPGSISCARA